MDYYWKFTLRAASLGLVLCTRRHRCRNVEDQTNEEEVHMKKELLKGMVKASEMAVKEACGSKSSFIFFEVEMPKCLKEKKIQK